MSSGLTVSFQVFKRIELINRQPSVENGLGFLEYLKCFQLLQEHHLQSPVSFDFAAFTGCHGNNKRRMRQLRTHALFEYEERFGHLVGGEGEGVIDKGRKVTVPSPCEGTIF